MRVTVYDDKLDPGNSVLVADDGRVSFLKGQLNAIELLLAIASVGWSSLAAHLAIADMSKGALLCVVDATAFGEDISARLRDHTEGLVPMTASVMAGIAEGIRSANQVFVAGTKYGKAIAVALVSLDKKEEVDVNIELASRELNCCPPIINLLFQTLQVDRSMSSLALVQLLDAQRYVMDRLNAMASEQDSVAVHAKLRALLVEIGMAGQVVNDNKAGDRAPQPGAIWASGGLGRVN